MDTHKTFVIGLLLFALILIAYALWVIVTPPKGDEMPAMGVLAIGVLVGVVGYGINRRDRA
jgi:hypothetical protein